MKVLYQIQIYQEANIEYDMDTLVREQMEVSNQFVFDSIEGVLEHQEKIISLANQYLKDWTFDRLSKVDQAILELAIYELMYTSTPPVVSINEAIELSKKYSEEAVCKMINGVLDSIYHDEAKN